jgi:hypothetical protein
VLVGAEALESGDGIGVVIGSIVSVMAFLVPCLCFLLLFRRSHGRRATALKELALRPPAVSQLRTASVHKVKLLLNRGKLAEADMAPRFVPATSEGRKSIAEGGRGGLPNPDLKDESVSSDEDSDEVFRPQTGPSLPDTKLHGPEGFEVNSYAWHDASQQQLELHGPIGEITGTLPWSDLLLSPVLDSMTPLHASGVLDGGEGAIGYNYVPSNTPQPVETPPARSMAAMLRERYTRRGLERAQITPHSQLTAAVQEPTLQFDVGRIDQGGFPEAPKVLSAHDKEKPPPESTLSTPVEADYKGGWLASRTDRPCGLPRRPLPVQLVGGDHAQRGYAGLEGGSPHPIMGVAIASSSQLQPPTPLQPQQPHLRPLFREPQTARQPSFAQRRAEARALTPKGTNVGEGQPLDSDAGPSAAPRSERLPPPSALAQPRPMAIRDGCETTTEALPPGILRERGRDLNTTPFRI